METKTLAIVAIILSTVQVAESGECCKAHYDTAHNPVKEKWCANYCCYSVGRFECCDRIAMRATEADREEGCSDWFTENVWATVLISIGSIGFLAICIAICMWCYCRGRRTTGRVPVSTTPNNTVAMTHQRLAMEEETGNPYHTGYDQ